MKKAIFGLASNDAQAQRIVDQLLAAGFANEDISILYPNWNRENDHNSNRENIESLKNHMDDKIEKNTKAPEGSTIGAWTGGILGGSLGLLAGIGALAIPGFGPF